MSETPYPSQLPPEARLTADQAFRTLLTLEQQQLLKETVELIKEVNSTEVRQSEFIDSASGVAMENAETKKDGQEYQQKYQYEIGLILLIFLNNLRLRVKTVSGDNTGHSEDLGRRIESLENRVGKQFLEQEQAELIDSVLTLVEILSLGPNGNWPNWTDRPPKKRKPSIFDQ
ncbi:MAG: hypothetical protein COU69_00365 [Candidatus Pacebacteria bacterium CG10_big_fil_rev_8_21_14_0_10_56_10]|nr:MAG: hypothetical protein COU69_00365 [Candidatus Pacebacteria bacterium CG10_big_fil_rev_8_21_14_0_10_56_10]